MAKTSLPQISGRTVFQVLFYTLGLTGLVTLIGVLLYWQFSTYFPDLDQTPWPLIGGGIIQTLIIFFAVDLGWRRKHQLTWADLGLQRTSIVKLALFAFGGFLLAGTIEFLERQLGIKPGDLIPDLIAPQGFVWVHFIATLLVAGIIAPIAEELIFRGVIYSWLRSHLNMPLAILCSSAMFGLVHAGYPYPLMVLVGVMGAVFAWSFERTGSLWVPIVLHSAQNSAVVIAIYATLYGLP